MRITLGKGIIFKLSCIQLKINAISRSICFRYEFYHDIELIYKNALQFNGEKSEYTLKSQRLLAVTQVSKVLNFNILEAEV
jgi:hypothetical protein